MAATAGRGLLAMHREQATEDARRTGRGLMRPEPASGRRPVEGRILELQSTAGNAAVEQYLQRAVPVRGAFPIVQRDGAGGATGGAGPGGAGGTSGDPAAAGILRYGSRGEDVRSLQSRLNGLGARPQLVLDGIFGRRTQRAVRRFQRKHPPLAADGDAGPLTMAEMDRAAPVATTDAGPGPATPAPAPARDDAALVKALHAKGAEYYTASRYALAYDEFTKAWEINGDPALLWNRAQSLRLAGGRRAETIALYEQFLASNADADEARSQARSYLEELRGPGRSGQVQLDLALVNSLHRSGTELYRAGDYLRAYDEFSKAHEISNDAALLWNRAQSLRLAGGRRAEAIALFEQFLASDIDAAEAKTTAREHLTDLRGPGRTGDQAIDRMAAESIFQKGRELYGANDYARAYDEFTKAWEITGDPALLWNRAQSMRLMGGRRAETIALYDQFVAIVKDADEQQAQARAYIEELRGPGRADGGGAGADSGGSGPTPTPGR